MKIYPKKEPKRAPFSLTLIKRKSTSDAKRIGCQNNIWYYFSFLYCNFLYCLSNLIFKRINE